MKETTEKKLTVKFIDLFAGIGGFRLGLENACVELGLKASCVFTSEIKPHAVRIYTENFSGQSISGDITQIDADKIPEFDVLLAGFPCQAFSVAGKREGFADTRGTLFFEIERILKLKRPRAFILENVEGLVGHDRQRPKDRIGRTLQTIIQILESMDYKVNWKVLNSADFGLPQNRKRIFIVGALNHSVSLNGFVPNKIKLKTILEHGLPVLNTRLAKLLTTRYSRVELQGKAIKDKRGGDANIHSWDIGLKGKINKQQSKLLEALLRVRRSKKWAASKGINWMDGMPLTIKEIRTFMDMPNLKESLDDLVTKGYLTLEHPKDLVASLINGVSINSRKPISSLEKGYNIVTGKLSFDINVILDPEGVCPTLVATDLSRIVVSDVDGLRPLCDLELRRMFGFPDDFIITGSQTERADVFGNTIPVAVVKNVAKRVIESTFLGKDYSDLKYPSEGNRQQLLFAGNF